MGASLPQRARRSRFFLFDEDGEHCANTQGELESEGNEPEGGYVASFGSEGIESDAYLYNFEGNRVSFNLIEQTNSTLIDISNSNLRIEESADEHFRE